MPGAHGSTFVLPRLGSAPSIASGTSICGERGRKVARRGRSRMPTTRRRGDGLRADVARRRSPCRGAVHVTVAHVEGRTRSGAREAEHAAGGPDGSDCSRPPSAAVRRLAIQDARRSRGRTRSSRCARQATRGNRERRGDGTATRLARRAGSRDRPRRLIGRAGERRSYPPRDAPARHRRRRLHRLELRPLLARRHPDDHVVVYDLLTYAGEPREPRGGRGRSCSSRATSATASSRSGRCARSGSTRSSTSRPSRTTASP